MGISIPNRNNCSTDRTLEIASEYAKQDSRIRVHTNDKFVGVMENHNIAMNLASRAAKYCKLSVRTTSFFRNVLIPPGGFCRSKSVGRFGGSYSLAGKKVMYSGLEYKTSLVSGKEICRATLLGDHMVFGCPTSLLYRADLVRKTTAFFRIAIRIAILLHVISRSSTPILDLSTRSCRIPEFTYP